MITRRIYSLSLAILALASWPLTAAGQQVNVAGPVKDNAVYYVPPLTAEEEGFWKEQGIEAKWVEFSSGVHLSQALIAGSVALGLSRYTAIIDRIARGIPMLIAANQGGVEPWYSWVLTDSPIKHPEELKGKKFAVSRLGTVTHVFTLGLAKRLGIEKDVKIVAVGGIPPTIAALKARAVDAVVLPYIRMIPLEVEGVVRRLPQVGGYFPWQDDEIGIFSTRELVEKKTEVAKRTIAGLLKANSFIMDNPGPTVERLKRQGRMSEKAARRIYETMVYSRDGAIPTDKLKKTVEFLLEYGLLPREKAPAATALYTEKFVSVK